MTNNKTKELTLSNPISESHETDSTSKFEQMRIDFTNLIDYFCLPNAVDSTKEYFEVTEAYNRMKSYIDEHNRLLYSEITKLFIDDKRSNDYFVTNVDSFVTFCWNEQNNVEYSIKMISIKLEDHVNLINTQYNSMFRQTEQIKNTVVPRLENDIVNIKDDQKKITKKIKKATRSYDNMLSQMVAIVSIFVSIAFVMFGGMSLLNDLFNFSGLKEVPVVELLCLGSLIGIIIVIIISAFMYFIFKLLNIKDTFLCISTIIICVVLLVIMGKTFYMWRDVKLRTNFEQNVNIISEEQ